MAKISNLDFYAILGVHPHAEDIVIRAAFKALAQRYHPDRFSGSKDEAHRRMADLTNAYETLADPARRRKYDRRRGLTARQARFYFKNPERERYPPFTAFALRAAARKAQYYRNAVYVLMVVVVILSAFNVHQHAAQIREVFAWTRPASGTMAVATPGAGASAQAASPTSADPASATTAVNVRILPIGQGTSRPIGPSVVEPQAPAVSPPDTAVAVPPAIAPSPSPVISPLASPLHESPAPSAAAPSAAAAAPAASPPAGTLRDAAKTPSRSAAVEPQKAHVAAPVARPAPSRPAAAKTAEPERNTAPPTAADADRCGPELVALGLCNRSSTAKGQ
jgi:hypothetical protein